MPCMLRPDFSMTVSIGVAELSPQVLRHREWIIRADRALYQAKKARRNCIRVFDDDSAEQSFD